MRPLDSTAVIDSPARRRQDATGLAGTVGLWANLLAEELDALPTLLVQMLAAPLARI